MRISLLNVVSRYEERQNKLATALLAQSVYKDQNSERKLLCFASRRITAKDRETFSKEAYPLFVHPTLIRPPTYTLIYDQTVLLTCLFMPCLALVYRTSRRTTQI